MIQEKGDSFRYDCGFEDIDDTFQIEIVEDKQVHKCKFVMRGLTKMLK